MNSQEIRKKFIEYFKSLDHKVFPSDSLIPSSDPTLLFTTAGMVQFKDYFLGKKTGLKRACSVQKCLRTSDIEQVGKTPRHLTFFEMLGNFSFGDYFKKEAILWAWEFITKIINLDTNRLYITVYKEDDEAYEIWSNIIPKEKIYKLSEETNFWKMGDTGPCGPCSEILYDLGKEYGCGSPDCSPACSCDRFIEVWNLVFTQFDLQPDGKLLPLKQKNIDTGMGLERLNMVVNKLKSVFDTDVFKPIVFEVQRSISEDNYNDKKVKSYINAISDHARAVTFAISEGIIPTTEGRGYVVRKLIRRAVRYLKLLGHKEAFLYKLIPIVVEVMKDNYPELELHREKVAVIVKAEEEKFLETLDDGLKIMDDIIKSSKKNISGAIVFKLYDTYGFPKELLDEIFKEENITYDEKEFIEAENKAKELSRASWKGVKTIDTKIYQSFPETKFVGYTQFSCKSKVIGIIKDGKNLNSISKSENVELIFDVTPFYGESGGQVGDKGVVKINGKIVAEVLDTKKFEGRIIHVTKVYDEIKLNNEVELEIDLEKRKNIMRHHTATHLLHKALRETLGEHAVQSGSLVAEDYFRFDFIHWRALNNNEITKIENIVNQKILECLPVEIIYTDLQTARNLGATALFEEKYGNEVRVVIIGGKVEDNKILQQPYSIELCGGTHCSNTGEIGIFKIISETSVGANLRRIEAICGKKVYEYITDLEVKLKSLAETVGTNNIDEIQTKVEKLIQQNKKLKQEVENIKINVSTQKVEELFKEINGTKYLIRNIPNTELKFLRSLSDEIIKNFSAEPTVILLYSLENKKISLVIRTNELGLKKGISLKKFTEKINNVLKIKCGGREDFIQGGGTIERNITPDNFIEILI